MSLRPVHNAVDAPKKRRSKWWLALWVLLALILLLVLAGFWIWSQRFNIIENEIKSQLKAAGVEAQFKVTELGETAARVEDLKVFDLDKVFLEAQSAEVTYEWREAMEGEFKTLKLSGLSVDVAIDEKGRPNLSFIEALSSSDGESGATIDQVEFVDSRAVIQSPIGRLNLNFDGAYKSAQDFVVNLDLISSEIAYGDVTGAVSGPIKIVQKGQHPRYDIDLKAPRWAYKELSGQGLSLSGQGQATLSDTGIDVSGDYAASFDRFAGRAVFTDHGDISWKGLVTIPRQTSGVIEAKGDWTADVKNINMPDKARRTNLAKRLALYESLSKAPVMENFAQPLTGVLSDLLKSGNAKGAGAIVKNKISTQISLAETLSWDNQTYEIKASSIGDAPLYHYERSNEAIELTFEADLNSPWPIKIRRGILNFRSTNGRNLKGVNLFDADVTLPKTWSGRTQFGDAAILKATTAQVNYQGKGRVLSMNGRIDYDGDIPGGKVLGLKADGRLKVGGGEATNIYFTPRTETRVTMDSFETQAPWIASNVSFTLIPDETPLFQRRESGGKLSAQLTGLEADLSSLEGEQELHLSYGAARVSASIADQLQTWRVAGQNVRMTSDTIPSVDTIMEAPIADLDLVLEGGGSPRFVFTSPSADVTTPAVTAKGLSVKAEGLPEQYRVDYENGLVDLAADDLPAFQMAGFANYKDKIWAGRADSFLPFGAETPIDIDYKLENGRIYADVDVPDMNFSPRKLQPQMFIPALRGKIADVTGRATAKMHLEFAQGEPMTSSGSANLIGLNVGTLPGPITGLNSELKFSSFFPLVTDGLQTLKIDKFDPGFPLPSGEVTFETVADGVKIHSARWPLGSGQISLAPTQWIYTAEENRMELRIEDVSLGEFLGDAAGENFSATGIVNGVLPIVISGVSVEVDNGQLAVKEGGIIKFQSDQTNAASAENPMAGYAFDALKEFKYQELVAHFNGPLDGLVELRLVFEGSNPEVLGGAVFKFNVKLEGELLNIARSFQLGDRIAQEITKAIKDGSSP